MLIAAGGRGHRVKKKEEKKELDFHYSEIKNQLFGNVYSTFDFLIITKNSGGLAAMSLTHPSIL